MIWFLAILVLIGLAIALKAGLVAFAGYVLLGVYLLSRYLARRWVHDLTAERDCDAAPREIGESTEVAVTLTNTGGLPILWVLVEDLIPDLSLRQKPPRLSVKGKRLQVVSLGARQKKTVKYTVTFLMRGYYPLGPTLLETGDVFGLHRRHRVIGKPVYVMVYPKVLPLPKYDFASERPIGEVRLQNRLFEDPTRTAGVREYQVGDPLQRVHWKVTARTGVSALPRLRADEPRRGNHPDRLPCRRLPSARRADSLRSRRHDGRERSLCGVPAESATWASPAMAATPPTASARNRWKPNRGGGGLRDTRRGPRAIRTG